MSKADDFLKYCKEHCNEWVCSLHTTGSNQPAAIFREVKKMGYKFEEVSPNRWAKTMFCEQCHQNTTHYKLLSTEPQFSQQQRIAIDPETRERILTIFDERDAFTDAKISSVAEIDHKIPWTRLEKDIDASELTDDEIKEHFQLLTREHNLLKDRACDHCKKFNERLPLFNIEYWYEGDQTYKGSCVGCGWYDGVAWRAAISKLLKSK